LRSDYNDPVTVLHWSAMIRMEGQEKMTHGRFATHAAPRLLCAWCGDTIRDGSLPESHGICLPCSRRFRLELLRQVEEDKSEPALAGA
jgi:hypothetical protein